MLATSEEADWLLPPASRQAHHLLVIFNATVCVCVFRLTQLSVLAVVCADNDKSSEDRQKEEELLTQIHKLVETRDFLVDDVEFERLRCAPPPVPTSQQEFGHYRLRMNN